MSDLTAAEIEEKRAIHDVPMARHVTDGGVC